LDVGILSQHVHAVLQLLERVNFFVGPTSEVAQVFEWLVGACLAVANGLSETDGVKVLVPSEDFFVQVVTSSSVTALIWLASLELFAIRSLAIPVGVRLGGLTVDLLPDRKVDKGIEVLRGHFRSGSEQDDEGRVQSRELDPAEEPVISALDVYKPLTIKSVLHHFVQRLS